MLPAHFLAAQRVRTCLLYNARDKARLSTSGRLQDDPFVPMQKKYAMHHLARSIEVCRQYHLLRAGDLAEIKLPNGAFATPICRSQIYHLFSRRFQKQNLHSAFLEAKCPPRPFPIRVIIETRASVSQFAHIDVFCSKTTGRT